MKNETMKNIMSYVKDEHKDLVRSEVDKIVNEFVNLSEDEKEDIYCSDGTIGFVFDRLNVDFESVMIDYNEKNEVDLCDLILDYLEERNEDEN